MNKQSFLFVIIVLVFNLSGLAQSNSSQSPNARYVIEARKKINAYVEQGAVDSMLYAVKKADAQIDQLEHLLLFPEERWLIEIISKNFIWVLDELRGVNQYFIDDLNALIYPPDDDLFTNLQDLARKQEALLKQNIHQSINTAEKKEVLILCFNSLLADEVKDENIQQQLNDQANVFLTTYPETKYSYYIKNYVRYEYKISPFAWGVEFFAGYGFFSGQLGKDFSSHVPFGFSFDAFYKRFNLHLSQYIATGKTQQDLMYKDVLWQKGSKVSYFIPRASLGYALLKQSKVNITPSVGIGIMNLSPTATEQEKHDQLKNHSLSAVTYSLGMALNFDVSKNTAANSSDGLASNGWFVNLRYNYFLPGLKKDIPELNGNMHAITLGISGYARNTKRVY